MIKLQKLDRAKVDAQNLLHRVARNFFQYADKNKRKSNSANITVAIEREKKRATEKIKTLQQKIQVMSTHKVDLATKLMQFAELNIDNILKGKQAKEAKITSKATAS